MIETDSFLIREKR